MKRTTLSINCESLKPLNNVIYIKAKYDKRHTIKVGELELYVETKYQPHHEEHVCQDGIIAYSNTPGLNVGDHVYGHHFMCDEDNEVEVNGEILYRFEAELIYAVEKDGNIFMTKDWNFLSIIEEPEKKTDSGIIIGKARRNTRKAIAKYLSEETKSYGVKEGDEVYFVRNSDYVMYVGDQKYYRVKNNSIIAKENKDN